MLTIDALNQITATHAAATGRMLDTLTPAILIPEHYAVQSLEKMQACRSRFRGEMTTTSLPDFCAYALRRHDEGMPPAGFIDPEAMRCQIFFNLGDEDQPGHADDTASLQLQPTAAWAALRSIAGQRLSQTQLAEWMEDWADHLRVTATDGSTITVGVAVQKIRTITIKAIAERTSTESKFSTGRSAMDQIEAAHAEQQPGELHFTAVPYEGLQPQTVTLRLSVITGDKPQLVARWVQREAQEEAIAQEFKTVLTEQIGHIADLVLGNFNPGR